MAEPLMRSKDDKWELFPHLLLGVCLTIVSTEVNALSPGAPFTATAPTRGTQEPPATAVSQIDAPALLTCGDFPLKPPLHCYVCLSVHVQAGVGIYTSTPTKYHRTGDFQHIHLWGTWHSV